MRSARQSSRGWMMSVGWRIASEQADDLLGQPAPLQRGEAGVVVTARVLPGLGSASADEFADALVLDAEILG